MIITQPTGLYKYAIPSNLSEIGDITYVISTTVPTYSTVFFQRLSKVAVGFVPLPFTSDGTFIVKSINVSLKKETIRPTIGLLLDFDSVPQEVFSNSNTITNVRTSLPQELQHIAGSIIARFQELSVIEQNDLYEISNKLMAINAAKTNINNAGLLAGTALYTQEVAEYITTQSAAVDVMTSAYNEQLSHYNDVKTEKETLQKLIGGIEYVGIN